MTLLPKHLGKKPRTALTNLFGKPECVISNWKRTVNNYNSAQPTELQVFTINDSDGEMADYMVLNDTRKRGLSVSRRFKKYQFFNKENKPNSIKSGFKTNKISTAMKKTDLTVITSEGKIVHRKLASKPLKFQTSKKNRRTKESHQSMPQVWEIQ